MKIYPFHLAIPVHDLTMARHFYGQLLGLVEGRSSDHWIDYNLFGHQLVVHLDKNMVNEQINEKGGSSVDGHDVPVPHFGVVLPMDQWEVFAQRIVDTLPEYIKIKPTVRFKGQPGEQGTLFFTDPSGNALEFKGFRNIEQSLFDKKGHY